MESYGYDYGPRGYDRQGWLMEAGFTPTERAGRRADAWGWSRPEFNVSAGAFGLRDEIAPVDWSATRWVGFSRQAVPGQRGWRTGEPWGGGISTADRIKARDLMTENPEAVTAETSLADVAKRMRDLDVGVIPIIDEPDSAILRGVITDRDIVVRAAADGKDLKGTTAGEVMSRDVTAVEDGASVRDVFSVMKGQRVRRVPVVDPSGRLVGIIAQADLAVVYAGLAPEREMEVEEVLERISEPARPRPVFRRGYDGGISEGRVRHGWRALKREARELFDRGYDRGWR